MNEITQSFEVVEPTEADFKSMTEDQKSEILESNVNIAVALLITKLIGLCKSSDVKFSDAIRYLNIDSLIAEYGCLNGEAHSLVKSGISELISCMATFSRCNEINSVIFAKNGKFSFLNEAGELA